MISRKSWLARIAHVKAENKIPIIAEIKPSSPAEGKLLGNRSITDIAAAYEAGGAACLSVVTGRWFGGELSMLSAVAKVTSLPLLRKDLIVNLDQIKESRDHGANAVLLTKKILRKSHLAKMIDLCISLNITPFVEVSSLDEVNEVCTNSDTIIGITNRNIEQKELDINSGLKSLNIIEGITNHNGAVISASGISSSIEANMLYQAGFDGLLVGTALLKAKKPKEAVRLLSIKRSTLTQVQ
jgi:indole-3-glycerol phosphate synthase